MKKLSLVFILACLSSGFSHAALHQISTPNALQAGVVQTVVDYKTLHQFGDFGLGVMENTKEEMIGLDDKYYRITENGKTETIKDNMGSAFALVTKFVATENFIIENVPSLKQLTKKINAHIKNHNIPYAIRIEGDFDAIDLGVTQKKSTSIATAMNNQITVALQSATGTGVGYYFPQYLSKISFSGYHLHFITQDKKIGGHLLQLKAKKLSVSIMPINNLSLQLPITNAFANAKKLNFKHAALIPSAKRKSQK